MILKNIEDIVDSRRFDYKKLKKVSIKSLWSSSRDINVIIPVKNRRRFVEPCIKYLQRAAQNSPLNISIIIVENDDYPTYPWDNKNSVFCNEYISIPLIYSQSNSYINKALCFNFGFKIVKPAKWYLFHDVDILVDKDFFQNIAKYLEGDPPFMQPYSNKQVMTLGYRATKRLLDKVERKEFAQLRSIKEKAPSRVGVSGGSVLVRADIFRKVGGYDPEFFYGYAPEDNFFWSKLEVACSESLGIMKDHHVGNGVYLDDPQTDVYHMFHVPEVTLQDDLSGLMNDIHFFFLNADFETKNKILKLKRVLLE